MAVLKSIFIVTLFSLLFSTNDFYTKREYNYVREGPASYYSLVEILPPGKKLNVVETSENWIKIKLADAKTGWLSKNSLTEAIPTVDYEQKLLKTWSSSKASKTGIAAAIKGLRQKIGITNPGDIDMLFSLTENSFTGEEYRAFVKELNLYQSKNKNRVNLSDLDLEIPEYEATINEMQIGAAVSARLLSNGFVKEKETLKYLTIIANLIAANASFYDWNFNVIVLDDDKVDGFACPGGYIFITKGALKMCSDEAELAFIIAHEMAHIVRKHGLQELTERKVQIKSDEAFAELEEELETEKSDLEKDLENMILNSYERIVNERLVSYEIEADKIAAVLIANCGYDPYASIRIAKKLMLSYQAEKDIFSYTYASPNDAKRRYDEIEKFASKKFKQENPGLRLEERIKRNIR